MTEAPLQSKPRRGVGGALALLGWMLAAVAATAATTPVAAAAETTALDTYLADLSTWSATFTQKVRNARGEQVGSGSGRLIIVRPGKFRWESMLAGEEEPSQLMVADGRNLWFLDYDLEQATVRPLEEALSRSPAMLLAGGTGLRAEFEVAADGRRDGLEWVRVRPRRGESDFREALFGFRGRELAQLVIIDKLAQSTTLGFGEVRRNATLDPGLTSFVLPEGVDLIGAPVAP